MNNHKPIARRCNAAEPVSANILRQQYGFMSILNMAILLAAGALLYIGFNILFGPSFEVASSYNNPSQEITSTVPHPDNEIYTGSRSAEVIYPWYDSPDVNGANHTQGINSRANNRRQVQLSASDNTRPAEQQNPDTHDNETAADSSAAITSNRSSKTSNRSSQPRDRRPQTRSQNSADNNPSKIDSYGDFFISGQVIDESGWPVPGIEVFALVSRLFDEQAAEYLSAGTLVQSSITNQSGFFQLAGLAEGEYKIHTAANDYYPTQASIISRTGVDNLKLVVIEQRKVLLYGLVETTSGKPLPGVEVTPLSDPERTAFTDDGGYYNLIIDINGNATSSVQFWTDGYQEQRLRLNSTETHGVTKIERNLALRADNELVTVTGSVTSAGSPVADKRVYLKSAKTKRKYNGTTDTAGKFIIPEVEIGTGYILWVSPQEPYQLYRQNNVTVPAGGLSNLAISLKSEGVGSLTGQMIDLDGNPIPNLSLFLRSKSSTSSHITLTGNSAGYFAVESVPEGKLTLGTSSLPKHSVNGIELQQGAVKEVELILDVGSHQLHGQVTDSQGDPVPAASVILTWVYRNNGITYESIHKSVSSLDGDFQFSQLGPGERTLIVAAPGYETANIPYEMGMPAEQTISVQLEPKMGG
ncbi:MAG: carboxypeptidase-like regulatory domain-containing protein [Amphritea sp.]